ncbi:MAG: hypothetical protein ACOY3Y_18030 [Acidobacteriota bacterium]
MKRAIAKVLPILVGIGLGVLILNPPSWLRELGPVAFLVTGTLAAVLLVGFVAFIIAANLPERISLAEVPEERVPAELRALAEQFRALGFEPAGPPYEVGVSPPGIMLPFVHAEARSYGTAFRTSTVPAKTAYDVVSLLEAERGGLTSCADPAGTSLPAGAGELRQVISGATPDALFEQHRQALAWLERQGVRARSVSASAFAGDFQSSIAHQRRTFLASPLRHAAVAIWRSATRTTPHRGPLHLQAIAARQLRELRTGVRG